MYVEKNVSSALDVAKLSTIMMKDETFRQVVKTQYRECASFVQPGHIYKWTNTNQLLSRESNCTGIKTGITWQAGPCLSASMKKDGMHVCVVVLGCCNYDSRWYEVPKLVNWGVKKIKKIQNSKLKPKLKKKIIKNCIYI